MGVVYSIVNEKNGGTYIGSTIGKGMSRWKEHLRDLKANKHSIKQLRFRKYDSKRSV